MPGFIGDHQAMERRQVLCQLQRWRCRQPRACFAKEIAAVLALALRF